MLTLNWIDCKTATLEGQLATIRMLSVSLKLPIQNFGVVSPPRSLPFLVSILSQVLAGFLFWLTFSRTNKEKRL